MSGGPVAVLEWFVGSPKSDKVQACVVQQGRQSDIALIDYRADSTDESPVAQSPLNAHCSSAPAFIGQHAIPFIPSQSFGAVLCSFRVYSLILVGPPTSDVRFAEIKNYDYHIVVVLCA